MDHIKNTAIQFSIAVTAAAQAVEEWSEQFSSLSGFSGLPRQAMKIDGVVSVESNFYGSSFWVRLCDARTISVQCHPFGESDTRNDPDLYAAWGAIDELDPIEQSKLGYRCVEAARDAEIAYIGADGNLMHWFGDEVIVGHVVYRDVLAIIRMAARGEIDGFVNAGE